MKKNNPIKDFQIRWNEPLGKPECPYMRRYVLNLKWFSIRLHIWYRSDDKRHMHNHAFNFWTIILKGHYTDVTDASCEDNCKKQLPTGFIRYKKEGEHKELMPVGTIRYRPANHTHYVGWPKPGTITLLLCGPKIQNWGFKVNDRIMRPLRYFSRYGHPDCSEE